MTLLALSAIVVALACSAMGVPSTKSITGIELGNYFYFSDTTIATYTRDQARAYCQSQEAELAVVQDYATYNRLRVALSVQGTYWIDGMDKVDAARFALNTTCNAAPALDYSAFPADPVTGKPRYLNLTARSCLSMVKGATAATSSISAIPCETRARILCAQDTRDCVVPTTTTPIQPPVGR